MNDSRLHAARYVFHKVTVKRYADAVHMGLMSAEEAAHHYGLAMINYDGIVNGPATEEQMTANDADMAKGFRLSDG